MKNLAFNIVVGPKKDMWYEMYYWSIITKL